MHQLSLMDHILIVIAVISTLQHYVAYILMGITLYVMEIITEMML